ncbi:Thaumatin-like protein 1 [Ceratobasidium theobromae]|uniref:Thaumatin-like protein 1 n=1 Tax=Ceratobasidium theobromae TaxID=1582974 RepID=A0A5N5QQB2_9AGAM|nr:Thaumatin-like protein 1 [Ceratobasidium theobromae]
MPLNSGLTLALRGFLLAGHIAAARARRWTVNNDCPFTIWPAIYTRNTSTVALTGVETGWEASAGSSRSFVVPEGWTGGVIWARRNCDFSSGNNPQDTNTTTGGCVSGGCPGGLLCTGLGTSPTTHAEWTLAPGDGSGADYYDVSIVDGFNLPLQILPSATNCGIAECAADLNANCPDPLRGPFAPNTTVPIGCKSACTANLDGTPNNSAACCTGQYAAQGACPSSGVPFYDFFKKACPFTYAYPQDVTSGTSLQTCPGSSYADYTLTFCPPSALASSTASQSISAIATSGTITGIPSATNSATTAFTTASLQTTIVSRYLVEMSSGLSLPPLDSFKR